MRKIFVLLFFIILTISASARIVPIQVASSLAKQFLTERSEKYSTVHQLKFSDQHIISDAKTPLIYVFNIENDQGFVMMSAESNAYPILGYSFNGSFDSLNISPSFRIWIENYKNEIKNIYEKKIKATKSITDAWHGSFNSNSKSLKSISPLLTTKWGQGCYYNDSCPVDMGGPCGHVVTGCVATAMAQAINYHDFPANGSGSHSYQSSYGKLTAYFGNTTYDWNKMSDTLTSNSDTSEIASVAQLISHCGIAVEMMYSSGGSGAYSSDAEKALVHYFNFSPDLEMIEKINYPDSIWADMLRKNLDSLMPLYYSGSGSGGHAFVCDGYQGTEHFHFNWGWNGSHDGYFYVSSLNPGGMNFSQYQSAIFNMKPATANPCSGSTSLNTPKGNVSDGSVAQNYFNNSNCTWTIQPGVGESVTLDFYTFDIDNSDIVNIYDGSSTSANMIGSYSGNILPSQVNSTSPAMTIEFISDSVLNGQGWSASYFTNFCKGYSLLTKITDTVNDGSGIYNYNDNTDCHWLIQPPGANTIHLEFLDFKTESGFDYLTIYDGNSPTANLLGSFDGHNLPGSITSSGGSMYLVFNSDGGVVDDGFTLVYTSCIDAPVIDTNSTYNYCQGDSVLLHVPSGFQNYQWQYFGADIAGKTDSVLYAKQAGHYSVVTNNNNCQADTSNEVTVIEFQNPTVSIGNDTTLCENHTLALNAGPGFSYLWSFGDTTQSVVIDTTIFGLGSNNYTITITDSNGCKASDTINITFISCIGIEEINLLKIYPNPTNGLIKIYFNKLPYSLILTDITGKIIHMDESICSKIIVIDMTEYPNGIYLLKANYQNKTETFKIILQKNRP